MLQHIKRQRIGAVWQAEYKQYQHNGENMIKQETLKNGLIRTYSDQNKYIIQVETGIEYAEAIDIPNKFTYIESDKDLPKFETEEE